MGNENQRTISDEIKKMHEEIQLMRTLASRLGFFQYYFDQLKNHRTQYECFNAVNDKYMLLFGEYRYDNYNSFRNQFNKNQHLLD